MSPERPFTISVPPLASDPAAAERGRARWRAAAGARRRETDSERALLDALFGNAPFLAQCAARRPEVLAALLDEGADAAFARVRRELDSAMAAAPDGPDPDAEAARALRRARLGAALVIGAADVGGAWDIRRSAAALSEFAAAAIGRAVDYLLLRARERGELAPPDPARPGEGSGLVVLAMGKLGGGDLNYSSDVDLIVLYDADKAPATSRMPVRDAFVKLTRRLGRLLEERTGDGYAFRVDFRLRPDPSATPLAVSVAAAEGYYASLGQNWERAAMIKARPVAGDFAAAEAFLRAIRPFVWRRHLDFAAIRDVQALKRQIRRHRGGGEIAVAGHDLKVGRGGVRDIEFFVQTQQLIWGGRDPSLRARSTEAALDALAAADRVDAAEARDLVECYWRLRRVEHRIQMTEDRQTHGLPAGADEFARLAAFLGYPGAEAFAGELRRTFARVSAICDRLFADAAPLGARLPEGGNLAFTGADPDPETRAALERMGFRAPDTVADAIRAWHRGRSPATRSARARELLTELAPRLLEALAGAADPDQAFVRFDAFLRRLPAGVQLFSLFLAQPALLELVAEIVGGAPRVANYLADHPGVLDAVLSQGFFDDLPGRAGYRAGLAAALAAAEDFQDRLEIARRWAADEKFRVSVRQLRGARGAGAAGRALSDIADAVVAAMLEAAGGEFAVRHGRFANGGLAVLGFGKLGGRMLSRGSDLDLVFVYENPGPGAASDGRRALSAPAYYARLGQRLITALTARTGAGRLFDVDMRLRPEGDNGPLAVDCAALERYYRESAWTWELMALTRARVVCGPPELRARLEALREDVLTAPRDPARLARDAVDMRRRIAAEHATRDPLALKYVPGGLVDVEFAAQVLALRAAPRDRSVLRTGTRDALAAARAAGALAAEDADALIAAADLYYNLQAVLRLCLDGPFAESSAPDGLTRILARAGEAPDFAALKTKLERTQDRVRGLFETLVASAAADPEGDSRP